MNKRLFLFCLFLTSLMIACSDDEPEWNAEEVCPEAGINIYGMPNRGTFTDERDGQVYRYTTIGNQVWMAENLRYDAPYSMCCNDIEYLKKYCELIEHSCETTECCKKSMCNNFGRYYSLMQNGDRFGNINLSIIDTICPKGWHVPTREEWNELKASMVVQGESDFDAAIRMKSKDSNLFAISKEYLNEYDRMYVGSDACALMLEPSGYMESDGHFFKTGAHFVLLNNSNAYGVETVHIASSIDFFSHGFRDAVRCVMD
ncbi:FISUMP domain-containing protein [uncultured Fibrobacter sp.]|jgi:Fibrobacter succinogenes major domain (Fib_succ_major).|uniref:FISUMP domain-containing protein n=1 Tax=uncultured Fibrobacter sp. TaxID=261512 RepID=UPI0025E91742|nr:FISUMP domain-containing protein [uncultured Fibrobacter sp.]